MLCSDSDSDSLDADDEEPDSPDEDEEVLDELGDVLLHDVPPVVARGALGSK